MKDGSAGDTWVPAERMPAPARDHIGGRASRPRPRALLAEAPARVWPSLPVPQGRRPGTPGSACDGIGTTVASVNVDG